VEAKYAKGQKGRIISFTDDQSKANISNIEKDVSARRQYAVSFIQDLKRIIQETEGDDEENRAERLVIERRSLPGTDHFSGSRSLLERI
jgi:hypothetical protein